LSGRSEVTSVPRACGTGCFDSARTGKSVATVDLEKPGKTDEPLDLFSAAKRFGNCSTAFSAAAATG